MVDLAPWDRMLQNYVDDQGGVDYARWHQESAEGLDQWLQSVCRTNVQALEHNDAIAFLINLYNALTIQQVLQKYPIPSILPRIFSIPNWLAFLQFFSRNIYTLNGQALSLNVIEHNMRRHLP